MQAQCTVAQSFVGIKRGLGYTHQLGQNPYNVWSAGVRAGDAIVTNGPLVEVSTDAQSSTVSASASFYRPLERLEIVRNGQVVVAIPGDGKLTTLRASFRVPDGESCWVAARVAAQKQAGEPEIQAHTNPKYLLKNGDSVMIHSAREALAAQWRSEIDWYESALKFTSDTQRREFSEKAEQALDALQRPLRRSQ